MCSDQLAKSVLCLVCFLSPSVLAAQDLPAAWLDGTTLKRLRGVYERGEFRGIPFRGKWSSDSRGYSVRQKDPETDSFVQVQYDVQTGMPIEPQGSLTFAQQRSEQTSPDGRLRLDVSAGDLFVRNLKTGERLRLMQRSPGRDVSIRNLRWSPDGRRILFVETDRTDVRKRSMLAPTDPTYPKVREQRFARVGGRIPVLRVNVVDVDGRNKITLPIDGPDKGFYLGEGFYLGMVEWAGNSEEVFVERLSRFRNKREFFLIAPGDEPERIFHETDPAWVVASQGKNSGITWIKDGQEFIVINEKDGWRHAWRYSREGEQLALLTPGDFDIIERSVIDEVGGWFYFYASPENATEKYLYRVPLDGSGQSQRMTPVDQPGTHDYDFSPDRRWAFHTMSTFDTPPVTELIEVETHRVVNVVEPNEQLHKRAQSVVHHPTGFLQLEIGDGISLDAWMMKPKDFDPEKKYPVFVYVYGEPHAQTVLNSWGAGQSHFLRVVADLGYLCVSIDNRGTPAPKGAAWRRSIFGSLGPLSTEEQAAALKALGRKCGFVDLSRVGIWGWSGGGSNTLNAMFRKPDDYHVGIAVVPKPQPHLYNAWFQEIFMRTQKVNSAGYQKSAPINFAEGLQGKLLIVTGSGETNTHVQIIEGLVDRLIELGKPFDYMVYPNRDHGLSEGKGTVVHVRMLITRYLLENLPAGPADPG